MNHFDAPLVPFQTNTTRRAILLSYWVVVLLALPLWWQTTSIERLPLPTTKIRDNAAREIEYTAGIDIVWTADSKRPDTAQFSLTLQRVLDSCQSIKFQVHDGWSRKTIDTLVVELSDGSGEIKENGNGALTYFANGRSDAVLAASLAKDLCELASPRFTPADEHRTVQYAPRYRLAFSVMNEDASLAPEQSILDWQPKVPITNIIYPLLHKLSPLHNFSIEAQLQLQAPLAFQPIRSSDGKHSILSQEQLGVFVNSAEWSLSSAINNDPVLHFLLFVPSVEHRPLIIEDLEESRAIHQSFLIPRWGGIVIYNTNTSSQTFPSRDLQIPFEIFRSQLLGLLGVPSSPLWLTGSIQTTISNWRLEVLLRRRARENVKNSQDALTSIIGLVDSMSNMPVGRVVRDDVTKAVTSLERFYKLGKNSSRIALSSSADAFERSSRAFFHPSMLGLLYFPAEHTFAVYGPLFAPALVPLIATLVKELKTILKERRKEKEKKE